MKNKLCIIPLRSNSKEIKNKNIFKINNIPLCMYAINEAIKSKIFNKIIIASDSEKYFNIIKKNLGYKKKNNIEFFKRSKKSSSDKAPTEIVLNEVLKKNNHFDVCYLIQATSPLIKFVDIVQGIKHFEKNNYDSLFSGYYTKKFFWKNQKNKLLSLNYNYKKRPMRQNHNKSIVENGAFYIFNIRNFFKYKSRLFKKIGVQIMPKKRSIEIDDMNDLNNVRKILKKN